MAKGVRLSRVALSLCGVGGFGVSTAIIVSFSIKASASFFSLHTTHLQEKSSGLAAASTPAVRAL